MPKETIKIAIDTNLWISHVFNQFHSHLNAILEDDNIEIITSPELTLEIYEVISRTKFKSRISSGSIFIFKELFEQATVNVQVVTKAFDCRDPKDNHLLSLAIDGDLDFLLTGDSDLLALDPYGKTRIMKVAQFLTGS